MDTRHMDISEIWPPFALHLRSGDMELSPVREADIPELAQIARGGVRRDGIEAFLVNWDSGTDEQVARSLAQYHWSTRGNFTVDEWTIEFTVRVNGRAIGVQGVTGRRFPLTRTVSTGSWLALPEQGCGYGTRMRRMIIEAFTRYFGAARFDTAYFDGNDASRRVSEKLGYSPNGDRSAVGQNGTVLTEHRMVLRAEDYVHTDSDLQVTGAEAFRTFLTIAT
ncbi:succinyl-CoA transferase Rv0802c [Brevibacterium sediminis]|uniref:Succinyl-CoA transferase Rv0802c n=2 Tax=Brevibacterium TaxID=1696 RepID=A0ABQ1LCA5_9MICO|nr:GNAT family protein [Brevibacterium sediminis]GGC21430.1 succinyl-CoA transferase Rv0802c [Brevibacterium sediminis]